jgi:hypothetical protein
VAIQGLMAIVRSSSYVVMYRMYVWSRVGEMYVCLCEKCGVGDSVLAMKMTKLDRWCGRLIFLLFLRLCV